MRYPTLTSFHANCLVAAAVQPVSSLPTVSKAQEQRWSALSREIRKMGNKDSKTVKQKLKCVLQEIRRGSACCNMVTDVQARAFNSGACALQKRTALHSTCHAMPRCRCQKLLRRSSKQAFFNWQHGALQQGPSWEKPRRPRKTQPTFFQRLLAESGLHVCLDATSKRTKKSIHPRSLPATSSRVEHAMIQICSRAPVGLLTSTRPSEWRPRDASTAHWAALMHDLTNPSSPLKLGSLTA